MAGQMTGTQRRAAIVERIRKSTGPVPGKALAADFAVSRQVIVQDIALIRAAGYDILSTNRGYILEGARQVSRVVKVRHTEEQSQDEMFAVVDLGGVVCNVMINHRVYGRMEAELNISSRRGVLEFMEDIRSGRSSLLMNITSGYHYHRIDADSVRTLDLIEEALEKLGFLVEQEDWEKEMFGSAAAAAGAEEG